MFCPPGATWNYNFVDLPAWGGSYAYTNETIKYVRDSIVGTETAKVLSHKKFFMACNLQLPASNSLIKQKGDTVFFRNLFTNHTWQVLYNFAATPGSGWQITLNLGNPITYSVTVDSIKQVMINGTSLKRLFAGGSYITERFGWNAFLFNFYSITGCDGDYFDRSLCYEDNQFGNYKFGGRPCNFSGVERVGLNEETQTVPAKIYPNPFSDALTIETSSNLQTHEVRISDVFGKEVKRTVVEDQKRLDLTDLKLGVYILTIKANGKPVETRKIIKE